jgi:hypothetical protein
MRLVVPTFCCASLASEVLPGCFRLRAEVGREVSGSATAVLVLSPLILPLPPFALAAVLLLLGAKSEASVLGFELAPFLDRAKAGFDNFAMMSAEGALRPPFSFRTTIDVKNLRFFITRRLSHDPTQCAAFIFWEVQSGNCPVRKIRGK